MNRPSGPRIVAVSELLRRAAGRSPGRSAGERTRADHRLLGQYTTTEEVARVLALVRAAAEAPAQGSLGAEDPDGRTP